MNSVIIKIADQLPAPLSRLVKNKGFLYLCAAGTATVCDILLYFITFNYFLQKQDVLLGSVLLGAPGISLAVSYSFGLLVNFTLSKWLIFTESNLRTRHQFFRFTMVAIAVLFANYGLMKILIDALGFFPTVARASSAISIGVLSFSIHKAFSFRIK
jgi:putative flippase GtrA